MRRLLFPAAIAILSGVLSCSDMPTAPIVAPAPPGTITVEGTITDRDGPPLGNTLLAFRLLPLSPNQPNFGLTAFTNASGVFQIALAPGAYDVQIQPGYQSGLPDVRGLKLEVKAGGSRFDYRYSGTRVAGDVTGPGGALLADAYITAVSTSEQIYVSVTTVGGHYSMLLPHGEYELYAEAAIYNSGIPSLEFEADIAASDTLIHFALTGNVVTATATLGGSTPLPNVLVEAQSDAIGVRARAVTRLDGTAVLYLPSGGYSFTTYTPDGSIVGPETGYWSISGDASIPIEFPGTRWDVTLRRTADGSALPFASIYAREIGANHYARTSGDLFGKFRLFVRPDLGYDLQIGSSISGVPTFIIPNLSSTADSTFDIFVDAPVP